jgi:hypothetical protein
MATEWGCLRAVAWGCGLMVLSGRSLAWSARPGCSRAPKVGVTLVSRRPGWTRGRAVRPCPLSRVSNRAPCGGDGCGRVGNECQRVSKRAGGPAHMHARGESGGSPVSGVSGASAVGAACAAGAAGALGTAIAMNQPAALLCCEGVPPQAAATAHTAASADLAGSWRASRWLPGGFVASGGWLVGGGWRANG